VQLATFVEEEKEEDPKSTSRASALLFSFSTRGAVAGGGGYRRASDSSGLTKRWGWGGVVGGDRQMGFSVVFWIFFVSFSVMNGSQGTVAEQAGGVVGW